jgi:long-chain-fatty-acid--[acyl-carrier-protein] ligase
MDLVVWLEKEFGFGQVDADAMETVGNVILAACGSFVHAGSVALKPIPPYWFDEKSSARLKVPKGDSVTQTFLKQAARGPSRIAIADQTSGVKSYRDIIIACMILKSRIKKLDGVYIGIMMPASAAADILYLATLFAARVPVMVNWTVGMRNIVEPLDSVGVKHILTSKAVVDRITSHGADLSDIEDRFIFIESMADGVSGLAKFGAWLAGHISWAPLNIAKVPKTAAILFTSGSETLPKAVPLSHANVLANLRDILSTVNLKENDRLIGFLPPFHSFGLTGTILAPLLGGARVVYHPNPTESGTLVQLIEAYRPTGLMGTPTFLNGIVRVATKEQLSSLRLAVTGAEKCSEKLYGALKDKCANAVILEGYGVTECSPIISINDENEPKPFTIGKVMPSLEYKIVEPQTKKPVTAAGSGLLLVRGPSVFEGYMKYNGPSPFVQVDGKDWYSTGDLVSVDEDGVFTFQGRLKRFVKLGGEMISLPAIEAVLEQHYTADSDEGPVLAVEATSDEQNPELVLFTTRNLDRQTVNTKIREAGLSGLHNIRRIIKLKEIPTLGTGKTDYRALKKQILNHNE